MYDSHSHFKCQLSWECHIACHLKANPDLHLDQSDFSYVLYPDQPILITLTDCIASFQTLGIAMPHPWRAYNNIEDYITVLDDCMVAGTNNCTTYRVKLRGEDELKDNQASSKLIQCQY